MQARTHTHTHTNTHTHTLTHTHTHTHVRTHTHARTHTCTRTHTHIEREGACDRERERACIHACFNMMSIHTYTYLYVRRVLCRLAPKSNYSFFFFDDPWSERLGVWRCVGGRDEAVKTAVVAPCRLSEEFSRWKEHAPSSSCPTGRC